ncbi:hypothetical protein GJAV_G00195550 [Gymnothorax javanicus]|nr:hypothetical protein GJAV_G00195550 [Gymnothorax javanicus]
MKPSGLVLFGLPLWFGMKASYQPNQYASASVCHDVKDCLPHCACSKESSTECRSRSSCKLVKGQNLCLPYCGRKQVGCIDKNTPRPVIDKRCLKEGCNLCQFESNKCKKVNCSKGPDLNCEDFHVEVVADSFTVKEASKVNLTCEHNVSSVGG